MRLRRRSGLGSLRAQLILIPTAILLAGLIATMAVIAGGARARVQAEATSGMALGGELLADALASLQSAPDPDQAFAALIAKLPSVRHVTFTLGDAAAAPVSDLFTAAIAPRPSQVIFPAMAGGRLLGRITMRSNPSDEVGEIRGELLGLTGLLVAIWASIILLIRSAVTRGLRPLRRLGDAFDALERGEPARMPPPAAAELRQIGEQFNTLSAALAQATADNRLLIERLMSVQEAERRELAGELHDEIGPLLFGMRTDAACILRWSAEGRTAGIPARARSLVEHADGLQRINSRMLKRMRPLVLDEMGLAEALRAMLASWRARLPAAAWSLDVPDAMAEPEPGVALTAFRIVQEALTNAARHADAKTVEVSLACEGDVLAVSVRDDGCGLPDDARRGYGLLGMNERARQAGGTFTVRRDTAGGTRVTAKLPVAHRATATAA